MTTIEADSRGLVDLTNIPLSQLWTMDEDSNLSHALRRVTEPAKISAFQSALGEPPKDHVSAFNSAI